MLAPIGAARIASERWVDGLDGVVLSLFVAAMRLAGICDVCSDSMQACWMNERKTVNYDTKLRTVLSSGEN